MVRRKFHDQSDTLVFGGEGAAEDAVYDPHHQKHEQENRHDHKEAAGAAKECNCNRRDNGQSCRAGNRPRHRDGENTLAPVIHNTRAGCASDGAAKPHEKRHDRFALQTDLRHRVVKQERNTRQITGFLHQVEAKCDTEHKRCHHAGKVENIGEDIADEGDQERVDGKMLHYVPKRTERRRNDSGCGTGDDSGKYHRQKENSKNDAECHQLSAHRGEGFPVKSGEGACGRFRSNEYPVEQAVDECHFFFRGMQSAAGNHRLLGKALLDYGIKCSVIFFVDRRHGNDRNAEFFGEFVRVNRDALSLCNVHHIQNESSRNL